MKTKRFAFNCSWTTLKRSFLELVCGAALVTLAACNSETATDVSGAASPVTSQSVSVSALPLIPADGDRPCDIYLKDGNPCSAAHSTVRALFKSYVGPLYSVMRDSDKSTLDIGLLSDGFADSDRQTLFCSGTSCRIVKVYDQTTNRNDLAVAGPGGNGGQNVGVIADKLPVTAGGRRVYGMQFDGGMGYRNNRTVGVAIGSDPESIYMVTSAEYTNGNCCFDYGNAEITPLDTGNGRMHTVYFGSFCMLPVPWSCMGTGSGPWVGADLENGVFYSDIGRTKDSTNTGLKHSFVTAMVKTNGVDSFSIKDADAQKGNLTTRWSGKLPSSPIDILKANLEITAPVPKDVIPYFPGPGPITLGPPYTGYAPQRKEGAILLGTGGDNSNTGIGRFYEGVMTRGRVSDAAEAAVQSSIVAVGYAKP